MLLFQHTSPPIDALQFAFLAEKKIQLHVLRLDAIHLEISGNKWYKLKEYLKEATQLNKKTIVTFGGAYSNHIAATAAACNQFHFESLGIIRGEKPALLSPTLLDAQNYGMKLFFISRKEYDHIKTNPGLIPGYDDNWYVINEGGYGVIGMHGAASILQFKGFDKYTHICTAVGTGTTMAGLISASEIKQQIIGISVLKNNFQLQKLIQHLVPFKNNYHLVHDYCFGGYAKKTVELMNFINMWYQQTNIPTDFVYTGKLFYAINDMIKKSFFKNGSVVLIVHSGGLQGNRSLTEGTLIF